MFRGVVFDVYGRLAVMYNFDRSLHKGFLENDSCDRCYDGVYFLSYKKSFAEISNP